MSMTGYTQRIASASELQLRYEKLLDPGRAPRQGQPIPAMNRAVARKLLDRTLALKLFFHSYSVSLNIEYGGFDIYQMMQLAVAEGLDGLKIHVDSGAPSNSLASMSNEALLEIRSYAAARNLDIHLETSSISEPAVDEIVRLALQLGATVLRVYARPENSVRLSQLKAQAIADLSRAARIAETHGLRFVLEPHEVLKSHEVVEIVQAVNSPQVSLLFDFGNMVNANEYPLEALQTMGPHITQAHAKDLRMVPQAGGFRQEGVKSGTGDLNLVKIIHDLLLLGENAQQVEAMGLEEEVRYVSPPFRFSDEEEDPIIPSREPSSTPVPEEPEQRAEVLAAELTHVRDHIKTVRGILGQIHDLAALALDSSPPEES